jgi:glutamine amidotransferase
MIAVINYGAGNLYSISKALEGLGANVRITDSPSVLSSASAVVLPGVGAFDEAMAILRKTGLADAVKRSTESGKPFLGICLGMQLLFTGSEEGKSKGLGIFKGLVRQFSLKLKVPHMGWNVVRQRKRSPLWKGLPGRSCRMYFAHSFYPVPADKEVIAATTDYGVKFASMVRKDNVLGTQFHPEKSGAYGLQFLKNFLEMTSTKSRKYHEKNFFTGI